jgi:hypothetical protein
MEQLQLKEPVFIISRKDYATGERTLEGLILDNKIIQAQLIVTFKNGEDEHKDFLKLSGKYFLTLTPVEQEG